MNPTFALYTRSNRNGFQAITRGSTPSVFSSSRRTIFLVHGYLGNLNSDWLIESKNELLNRGNYNVIVVGWGGGANEVWYPQSASNTRAIGREIKLIAERLVSRNGANANNFWCVGHSLGAHTCGIAGMETRFGRVTGLDPAGPMWEDFDISAGINPSSANFVDIIHTDARNFLIPSYGQNRPLGHYDFYPNDGSNQPGCFTYALEELEASLGLRDDSALSCSHSRAPLYWIESIKNDCFRVRDKCSNHNNIPGSCSGCGNNCGFMGFAADQTSGGQGNYWLQTTGNRPYCLN